MDVLANSSCGYRKIDRSWHTGTKYLNKEKAHAAINSKLFKKLNLLSNASYEVELAEGVIEHKEPIIGGFFNVLYVKLRNLELYYNFFTKFCDLHKLEELEMDTDSLYLALGENEQEDCIRPEMEAEWEHLRLRDCSDRFTADAVANFCPRRCSDKHKKHDKREHGLFKE